MFKKLNKIEVVEGLASIILISVKGNRGLKVADYVGTPIWNENIEMIKDLKSSDMTNLRDDYIKQWIY